MVYGIRYVHNANNTNNTNMPFINIFIFTKYDIYINTWQYIYIDI